MKTRTLLLLSLVCGLAIMLAGAVFLFQLTTGDELAEPVPVGEEVVVGDMSVTVLGSTESDGRLVVGIEIGGVDDIDGGTGFRLIASGRPVTPVPASGPDACGATAVQVVRCQIVFDTSLVDGSSRVLFYDRGDETQRWVLA